MKNLQQVFAVIFSLACIHSANAGLIEFTTTNNQGHTIKPFEAIGQSFTAIDTNVEAGLSFRIMNATTGNDPSELMQYSLYEGAGVSGTLLGASTAFSLATDFSGFHMVDFSSINLIVGNVYSLAVQVDGSSWYWGIDGGYHEGLADGDAIKSSSIDTLTDFHIRVQGLDAEPTTVPEPSILALFGLGLAGMGFAHRRKLNSYTSVQ